MYLRGKGEIVMRVPGDCREIKYIAIEELSSGMYTVIKENITVSKEGLFKTITNLLGFNRTGEAITKRLEEALDYLKKEYNVVEKDGMISVLSD